MFAKDLLSLALSRVPQTQIERYKTRLLNVWETEEKCPFKIRGPAFIRTVVNPLARCLAAVDLIINKILNPRALSITDTLDSILLDKFAEALHLRIRNKYPDEIPVILFAPSNRVPHLFLPSGLSLEANGNFFALINDVFSEHWVPLSVSVSAATVFVRPQAIFNPSDIFFCDSLVIKDNIYSEYVSAIFATELRCTTEFHSTAQKLDNLFSLALLDSPEDRIISILTTLFDAPIKYNYYEVDLFSKNVTVRLLTTKELVKIPVNIPIEIKEIKSSGILARLLFPCIAITSVKDEDVVENEGNFTILLKQDSECGIDLDAEWFISLNKQYATTVSKKPTIIGFPLRGSLLMKEAMKEMIHKKITNMKLQMPLFSIPKIQVFLDKDADLLAEEVTRCVVDFISTNKFNHQLNSKELEGAISSILGCECQVAFVGKLEMRLNTIAIDGQLYKAIEWVDVESDAQDTLRVGSPYHAWVLDIEQIFVKSLQPPAVEAEIQKETVDVGSDQ